MKLGGESWTRGEPLRIACFFLRGREFNPILNLLVAYYDKQGILYTNSSPGLRVESKNVIYPINDNVYVHQAEDNLIDFSLWIISSATLGKLNLFN